MKPYEREDPPVGWRRRSPRRLYRRGGAVCSCTFNRGVFGFAFVDTEAEVDRFFGSKYVKSDPRGIYQALKRRLADGGRVLFIGLPCQVAAVKRFVGTAEKLYTVDLICHGTPSPTLLSAFLAQYGVDMTKLADIGFRHKGHFRLMSADRSIAEKYASDRYTIAFLHGLTYTENCFQCRYACEARVSDLTLGDAWGTELPQDEIGRGVSLALVQTEKGHTLLSMARLYLVDADPTRMMQNNHQLVHPSRKPDERAKFFRLLEKGKTFDHAVYKCYPVPCIKQKVKDILYGIKAVLSPKEEGKAAGGVTEL